MDFYNQVFFTNDDDITWWAMCIRAALVFMFGILLVRIGDRRFFGKNTIFDIILGLMFGSILSRAITGNSPFFPTLSAAATLVGLHWLLSFVSSRIKHIGWLFKGTFKRIIKDGVLEKNIVKRLNLSENDMQEWLRSRGHVTDPKDVKEAYFERDGTISVIPRKKLKIAEVKVEQGVQIVRIELE